MHQLPAGEPPIDLREHSQRLRYEAFSHFATQINQATDTGQVGQALARHVKYMLDAFLLRLLHVYEHAEVVIEIARGACVVREGKGSDNRTHTAAANFHALEQQLLLTGLPLQLEKEALQQHQALRSGLFDHPKATLFFALPLLISEQHQAVLSVASKEASPFGATDFRLIRLIGELVSGKLTQLLLAAKVERRNQQLSEANEELVTLNGQIKSLNLVLEQKVEQRTSQLKRANEELATIFYRTSHDFRRPLMTLFGLLNLAEMTAQKMAAAAGNPAAIEAIPRGIADSLDLYKQGKGVVGELDAMLSKLSTLSLLETISVEREPVDFAGILAQLQEKFEPELSRHNVQLTVRNYVWPPFYGNSNTIAVILENLLENAVQFGSPNPVVKINVYTEAVCAATSDGEGVKSGHNCPAENAGTSLPVGENQLVIQITDNGEGIDPAWRDKIFDLYVRASERSKGNGLGLYVVRKSVEQLKGSVTVESELYKGSVFTIGLPY